MAARYEHGSIILTSNTSFTGWGALLGDEVLATALLDRLLHHAEVIAINGSSYRMKERRTESRTPSTLSDTARHAAGDLPTGV
ncbi:ATP-binding protein [Dictyobacter kobayashii]|uniref:ATP-binding protein n=1 Tax=Dictyobacter kobayashii TaxID=2014872 RepID=UPI0024822BF9|nr:ATP-binding protein [Dictyobacter kobayashii]